MPRNLNDSTAVTVLFMMVSEGSRGKSKKNPELYFPGWGFGHGCGFIEPHTNNMNITNLSRPTLCIIYTPSTAALNALAAARLCRSACQEAADRAVMIM